MWDLLFAFVQLLSLVLLVAGFALASWYSWSRFRDDNLDE